MQRSIESSVPFVMASPNAESSMTAAASVPKVRLLAQGDSWFAYPTRKPPFGSPSNLISWLRRDRNLLIESLASNGDEAAEMLVGAQKFELIDALNADRFDGLLFSGGGNDIVGRYDFDFFLHDKRTTGKSGAALIREDRFARRVALIEQVYLDLIDLTADYGKNRGLPIFSHTYDLAIPNNQGAEVWWLDVSGPWMWPYLVEKGITEPAEQREIVHTMLRRFARTLEKIAEAHPRRFFVVPTQGTLSRDHWRDEIHATSDGFRILAEKLRARLYSHYANLIGAAHGGMQPLSLIDLPVAAAESELEKRVAELERRIQGAPAIVRSGSLGSGDAPLPSGHLDGWLSVRLRSDAPAQQTARTLGMMSMGEMPLTAGDGALDAIGALRARGAIAEVIPWDGNGQLANLGAMPAVGLSATLAHDSKPRKHRRVSCSHLLRLTDGQSASALKSELERDPQVLRVQRVPIRQLIQPLDSSQPQSGNRKKSAAATKPPLPWALTKIGWRKRVNTGQRIAVLDTGIDLSHPSYTELGITHSHNWGSYGSANARDEPGHGTHVTGTIVARLNSRNGHRGLIDANVEVMNIFDANPIPIFLGGRYWFSWVVSPALFARALARCLDESFDVVNLSIGGSVRNDDESEAIQDLIDSNIVVVAAAGNSGNNIPNYPAAYSNVIAVGASDPNDQRSGFSNTGPHLSLVAPGTDVLSTLPTYPGTSYWEANWHNNAFHRGAPTARSQDFASWPGTSMATPHVSAAVALLRHKYPGETVAQTRARLIAACVKPVGMQGAQFTEDYGYGRLDWSKL